MGSWPIVFLVEPGSVLDVELTVDVLVFPHADDGLGVVFVAVEGTELILDLEHYYGTAILGHIWSDYFCQCFDVYFNLLFV